MDDPQKWIGLLAFVADRPFVFLAVAMTAVCLLLLRRQIQLTKAIEDLRNSVDRGFDGMRQDHRDTLHGMLDHIMKGHKPDG